MKHICLRSILGISILLLVLPFMAPENTNELSSGGESLFYAKQAQAAAEPSMVNAVAAVENSCSEGSYLDLSTNSCRSRVKSYGFDAAKFEQNFSGREYTLGTCTEAALKELFDDIRNSGGLINIPACTLTIQHSFPIPSNTIIQGAGVGRTIFKAASGFSGNVLKTKYEQNVIIRDLSVDGGRSANSGVLVWYASNALVERVDVYNSKNSGIVFRFAKGITIRYSKSHGHQTYHGIDSKDCHPTSSTPDAQECAAKAGSVSPGSLWSTDYAVYSNRLYNNGTHGINIHGTYGEVAGNLSYDNQYGSKFPDALNVWIHHNKFSNNARVGSWVYATLDSSVRIASKVVYFNNIFSGNGGYPLDLDDPAREIYAISNSYQGNSPNRISISDAQLYVCAGTEDKSIGHDGSPAPSNASTSKCDLGQVAHIFGHDNSAPAPSAPTNTSVPPTNTSVPPTNTPLPPTNTSVPPTNTSVPPTNTSVPPTSTPVPPTSTSIPPTNTPLPPINTSVPPMNTPLPPINTSVPPTNTPLPPINTSVPPTNTPASTPTALPTVGPSNTPASDAVVIPGRVEAELYKQGALGTTYFDKTSGNIGGALRNDDVDIERTNGSEGGYNVGWIQAGEWLTYDIWARQPGTYRLAVRVNTWRTETRSLNITINGENVTGSVQFDNSDGHQVWKDVVVNDIQIEAGVHEVKIYMETDGFNFNYVDFVQQSSAGIGATPTPAAESTPTMTPTTVAPTATNAAPTATVTAVVPTATSTPAIIATSAVPTSIATAAPVATAVLPIRTPRPRPNATPELQSGSINLSNQIFLPLVNQ